MHTVFIPYKSIFLSELVLNCVQFFADPWTEKPGGLQSMGLQRVRQDLVTKQQ